MSSLRRWSRILSLAALILAAGSLLGGRAAAQSAGSDADRAAVLKKLAEYVPYQDARIDNLLAKAGFDHQHTALLPHWSYLSPVRKIEVAALAAQSVSPENGQHFLAVLSRQLAQEYATAKYDDVLAPHLAADIPATPVRFANHERVARAESLPDPELRKVVQRIADYSSTRGDVTVASLLTAAGVPRDAVYEHLREGRTSAETLEAAIARLPEAERDAAVKRMVRHASRVYNTINYDPVFASYVHDKVGPGIAASIPRDEPPPPDFSGPSAGRPDPGTPGGPGSGDPAPREPRNPPRRPHPSGGGESFVPPGLAGGGPSLSSPASGYESFNRMAGEPTIRNAGGSWARGTAAERFTALSARRAAAGFGSSFHAMTRGGMAGRLGGVVFGNDVVTGGKELPARMTVAGDQVSVVSRSGQTFVLPDADPADACIAVKMAADEKRFGFGLAGLADGTDDSSDEPARRFNVLLHPALFNTEMGRAAVQMDALPILMDKRLRTLHGISPEELSRWVPLFERLGQHGAFTWQVVDVQTRVELANGIVDVRPVGAPETTGAPSFVEIRPVIENDTGTSFDLAWAAEARAELPALAHYFPAYGRGSSFARTLAVVRWVKNNGGQLPKHCSASATASTPNAVRVCAHDIEAIPTFDRASETCSFLKPELGDEAGGVTPTTNSRYVACVARERCFAEAPLAIQQSSQAASSYYPPLSCLRSKVKELCGDGPHDAALACEKEGRGAVAEQAKRYKAWEKLMARLLRSHRQGHVSGATWREAGPVRAR